MTTQASGTNAGGAAAASGTSGGAGSAPAGGGAAAAAPGATGGATGTQATNPGAAGSTPSWRDSLAPEFKDLPALKDYPDINALAKSHVSLQSKLGANPIVRPKDDAKPEEIAAFYDALGRPKEAKDYNLAAPTGMPEGLPQDEAFKTAFLGHFHEAGLTQKQAETIYGKYMEHSAKSFQEFTTAKTLAKQKGIQDLQAKWKENYDANSAQAAGVIRTFGSPALVKWLEETGNGDEPAFVELFHAISQTLNEDRANGSGNGDLGDTPEKVQGEIAALQGDAAFQEAYNKKEHPKHQEAVDKMLALQRRKLGKGNSAIRPI